MRAAVACVATWRAIRSRKAPWRQGHPVREPCLRAFRDTLDACRPEKETQGGLAMTAVPCGQGVSGSRASAQRILLLFLFLRPSLSCRSSSSFACALRASFGSISIPKRSSLVRALAASISRAPSPQAGSRIGPHPKPSGMPAARRAAISAGVKTSPGVLNLLWPKGLGIPERRLRECEFAAPPDLAHLVATLAEPEREGRPAKSERHTSKSATR